MISFLCTTYYSRFSFRLESYERESLSHSEIGIYCMCTYLVEFDNVRMVQHFEDLDFSVDLFQVGFIQLCFIYNLDGHLKQGKTWLEYGIICVS